jgi:acetyl-CoA carboxylase biotin carboxyl carrier protein
MRTAKILELVKIVEDHDIEEIEISRFGTRIKISKSGGQPLQAAGPASHHMAALPQSGRNHDENQQPVAAAPSPPEIPGQEIKSPMVGTFYRAPGPDADPFVKVGDQIAPGQTLCIVEAMKVMNEIESEISGTVIKILVENGQPVEFDQPLFIIE